MAAINIEISDLGPAKLIKCRGMVDADTFPALKETLERLITAGDSKIILNLSAVDFMSSAGWGAVLANIEKAKRSGGGIKLSGLSEKLQLTYEMLELGSLVNSYDSDNKALEGFDADSA